MSPRCFRLAAVAFALIAPTACQDPTTPSRGKLIQLPVSVPASCTSFHATRLVNVSTSAQLAAAITAAQPGDRIQLADGVYARQRIESIAGTAANPIILCGSRDAVLEGDGITCGIAALFLREASDWIVSGITLRNSLRGITIESSDRVRVTGLAIHTVGQSGINVNNFSRSTRVDGNDIHDTGKSAPQFGEGIYVGSFIGAWVNGVADRSDSTQIEGNTVGPNIGAELIDVKEGTTGTVVTNNTLNGQGQDTATANLNSLVVISGDSVTMTGNRLENATKHGVVTYVQHAPWGQGNVFRSNTVALAGDGSYYGFNIGTANTVVGCDNTVSGGSFANVSCTP